MGYQYNDLGRSYIHFYNFHDRKTYFEIPNWINKKLFLLEILTIFMHEFWGRGMLRMAAWLFNAFSCGKCAVCFWLVVCVLFDIPLNFILHSSKCYFTFRLMLLWIPLDVILRTAQWHFTSRAAQFYFTFRLMLFCIPLNVILHSAQCYFTSRAAQFYFTFLSYYFTFLSISFYNPRRSMLHRAHRLINVTIASS